VKAFFDSWLVKLVVIVGGLYVAWKYAGAREFYFWVKQESPFWIANLKSLF